MTNRETSPAPMMASAVQRRPWLARLHNLYDGNCSDTPELKAFKSSRAFIRLIGYQASIENLKQTFSDSIVSAPSIALLHLRE